ncbi:MAG: hypothetical protein ABJC28_03980 [Acidobacteriota bacterium]
MSTAIPLALLYAASAIVIRAAAGLLGRRVPANIFRVHVLLPALFLLPAFTANRTIFPVDHAMSLPPWNSLPHPPAANPNLNDVSTQMAPWARAARMAWKEGSLPWRNRWNACGSALAANGQSAAFFPLTFLMMALPLTNAFNLAAALKLFVALTGTWLWLCELGVSRTAALFGSVAFAFSFTMVPWLLFPHTSVIPLWPWALFAIERIREPAYRRRATAALTLILVLELLAGHPESVALGALFTALWLGCRAMSRDVERTGQLLFRTLGAAAVAVGLTAFLLVPQILAIRASNRAVTALDFANRLPRSWKPHGPAWPAGAFTPFLPRSLGDAISSPMLPGAAGSFPEMALGHFGVAGWACTLLFFRRGSRRPKSELALLVPLLVGFAAAIALWPIFEIVTATPVIRLMLPLRFFTWIAFAGSALAAFEVDRLQKDAEAGRATPMPLLLAAGAMLLLAAVVFANLAPQHAASGALVPQRHALAGAALVLLAVAGTGFAPRFLQGLRLRPAGVTVLLALVATAELSWQGRRLYHFGPPAQFYPATPLVQFLAKVPRPFRTLGEGPVLYPGTHVFAGLEDVRSHDPVERRDYVEFLDAACGYDPTAYFKHVANVDCAALDFLNVRFLVAGPGRSDPGPRWRRVYAGEDGTVFENADVLPRVFAPERLRMLPAGARLRDAVGTVSWRREAILVEDPRPRSGESDPAVNGPARVSDYRESTNSAAFRTAAPAGGAIVVASLVQDGGWTARDDTGRTLSTGKANGPFLAVAIPGGDHRIRLRYAPPGSKPGAAVTLLTGAALLAAAVRRRVARSRRRAPDL